MLLRSSIQGNARNSYDEPLHLTVWQGVDCAIACPVTFGVACSGRGHCNNNGTCACFSGFFGTACQSECPGGAMRPCSGHGVCLPDGACSCSSGFYGHACDASCGVGLAGLVCSGRGACSASGACVCKSGMVGLISAYAGDVCQHIVYNRTGMRAFSTSIAPLQPAVADQWVSALAPLCIAVLYIATVLKRAVANREG